MPKITLVERTKVDNFTPPDFAGRVQLVVGEAHGPRPAVVGRYILHAARVRILGVQRRQQQRAVLLQRQVHHLVVAAVVGLGHLDERHAGRVGGD